MQTKSARSTKTATKPRSTSKAAQGKGVVSATADSNGEIIKALSEKQQNFIREYLIDLNGTQAYMRVFPDTTEKSARTLASRLLANVNVQAAIARERAKSAKKLDLSREMVLEQYQRLGFSDPRKMFDAYGQPKPITELDDDTAAAVQGFEIEMRQVDGPDAPPVPVLKIKMADRKTALDSIMKAQGWNSAEKHEVTGKGGGAIEHSVRVVLVPPKQKAEVLTRPIEQIDGEG